MILLPLIPVAFCSSKYSKIWASTSHLFIVNLPSSAMHFNFSTTAIWGGLKSRITTAASTQVKYYPVLVLQGLCSLSRAIPWAWQLNGLYYCTALLSLHLGIREECFMSPNFSSSKVTVTCIWYIFSALSMSEGLNSLVLVSRKHYFTVLWISAFQNLSISIYEISNLFLFSCFKRHKCTREFFSLIITFCC